MISLRRYINLVNLLAAIFDIVGRPLATYKFNALTTRVNLVVLSVVNMFLVYVYFYDLQLIYEGLTYTFLGIVCFILYNSANQICYLMFVVNQKAQNDTREAIGILGTNAIIGGISFGNVLSIGLSKIKLIYFS